MASDASSGTCNHGREAAGTCADDNHPAFFTDENAGRDSVLAGCADGKTLTSGLRVFEHTREPCSTPRK